jgi:hypothetical protein
MDRRQNKSIKREKGNSLMAIIKKQRWWAYLDDRGVIHIKRYTGDRAMQNCEQMPFCKGIFNVFEAYDYQHARSVIAKFLHEQQYYEKKVTQ